MRTSVLLPRVLDEDLARTGLSLSEYVTLMHLSEAPRRRLRIAELAARADLSPSRMTRLSTQLEVAGLITREQDSDDARAIVASLTRDGLKTLRAAWATHAESVRERFLKRIDPALLPAAGAALEQVADSLGRCP